jgi:hypothetical protein
MKSDERNVQPNKSKTQNFQEGSLERKLKRQEREQSRFDRETEAMIARLRKSGGIK